MRLAAAALAVLAAACCASCGYHVTGKADLLPKTIKTIAIPAWGNVTVRYQLSDRLPRAITREFLSRTRYEVVADPNDADAILTGAITGYSAFPTITEGGRTTAIQVIVILQTRLTERATGRILFDRPAFEARQRYEISSDQVAYFEESGPALERLAVDTARGLVSAILEAF